MLDDYQLDAVGRMKNGCILCGGVGSGKSRTALAYYYLRQGGEKSSLIGGNPYIPMDDVHIKDLYIITTARKRDTLEWEGELAPFLLSTDPETNLYRNKVTVDSWNNIQKYKETQGAFFIFDEQRVVGSGVWVKAFLKIAKANEWILLSATPGDTWSDYIPVFIANGFYKNRTEFNREHVVYSRFTKYPKVERYLNTGKLIRERRQILVTMEFHRPTTAHVEDVEVAYDISAYKDLTRRRWNVWEDRPIQTASELCLCMRKIVNQDLSRLRAVESILETHPRVIIFYNFDYELVMLKANDWGDGVAVAEWNGHCHQPIPETERWIYLVQYAAGCEGWNCVQTDTMIFYSLNYSYRVMHQAQGRIDRRNTPYKDLYYYRLKSTAWIDRQISRALAQKKDFNERKVEALVEQ